MRPRLRASHAPIADVHRRSGATRLRDRRTFVERPLATQPRFAPAYRTLAYVEFTLNPNDSQAPLAHYGKAVELDPEYGEAHYAIAFQCAATGDRTRGVEHYRKAMALGGRRRGNIGQRSTRTCWRRTDCRSSPGRTMHILAAIVERSHFECASH